MPARSANKWLVPGVGGIVAAVAIIGVVFMMSGSDSGKKADEAGSTGSAPVLAKMALPVEKAGSSSEDLAATIANLNKSQLNMQAQVYGTAPLDVKLMDTQLAEISTNAMRTAELATLLADTSANQGVGPSLPAAVAVSQQYTQIAQTAYGQVIEAQNLREQLAIGETTPEIVALTTASYGARLWNSSVTIQGVSGNPFVPFFGAAPPPVDVSITLSPGASATITTAAGGRNVNIWVANSQTFVTNTVWVRMAPVPVFDPFDLAFTRRLLTLEGQMDPMIVRYAALARLEQLRRLSLPAGGGPYVNVVGYSDYGDLPWAGRYVNVVSPADLYGNVPLNAVSPFTQAVSDWNAIPLYAMPTNGFLQMQMTLPRGIALADPVAFRAGVVPSFPNGTAMMFASVKDAGAPAGGTTALMSATDPLGTLFELNGDQTPISKGQVAFNQNQPKLAIQATAVASGAPNDVIATAQGGGHTRSFQAVKVTASWTFDAQGLQGRVDCSANGSGAGKAVTASGSATFDLEVTVDPSPGIGRGQCILYVSSQGSNTGGGARGDMRATTSWSVAVGDGEKAKAKEKEQKAAQDASTAKQKPPEPTEEAVKNVAASKPELGSNTANVGTTNTPADNPPQAVSNDPPPVVAESPPLPVSQANRANCNQIRGTSYLSDAERIWFLQNCPAQQQAVPTPTPRPAAAPPPPPPTPTPVPVAAPAQQQQIQQPPAEANRRDCLQINRGPLNNTETQWFTQNCGQRLTTANCDALRNLGTRRNDFQGAFFVQNCPIDPVVNVCAPGVVDSGGVPAGVGQTRSLDARCSYTVCIAGTIHGAGGAAGTGRSYTPAAALMRASPGGSLSGGCVHVTKFGGSVTFNCDGAAFPGIKFTGSFSYTVTRTGPAA